MGITDKDYADALEHQRAHQVALMKLELEKQRADMKAQEKGMTLEQTIENVRRHVDQPYGRFKVVSEQDLHHDAMKAPLSSLIDMWTVRWGGEWVNESEFQEDDFWRLALIRLTGANKLEKHNLANQYHSVYRIIE